MIGVLANTIFVIIGSTIGLIAKKVIPEQWGDTIMRGMGLISLYVGITGMLVGENALVLVISIVTGAMIGEAIDIDGRFNRFAKRLEDRFAGKDGGSNFAEGFVTASLIFCVGAMSIVGPLNAALKGDNTILFTKTTMDFFSSIFFASAMGIGVLCASATVLVVEGGFFLLAAAVAPFLETAVVNEMACAGNLLIIAIGLNLTKAADLKIMNYLPAILMPVILVPLYAWVMGLL